MTLQAARTLLQSQFTRRFRHPAHPWWLEAVEATCLNLDCIVIAGIGTGKTILIMLVLLMGRSKSALVICPLEALMYDQVRS